MWLPAARHPDWTPAPLHAAVKQPQPTDSIITKAINSRPKIDTLEPDAAALVKGEGEGGTTPPGWDKVALME
ncbi:MAG: hypothetical protein Q9201_006173 [Fulgogasparrea decipioides]